MALSLLIIQYLTHLVNRKVEEHVAYLKDQLLDCTYLWLSILVKSIPKVKAPIEMETLPSVLGITSSDKSRLNKKRNQSISWEHLKENLLPIACILQRLL